MIEVDPMPTLHVALLLLLPCLAVSVRATEDEPGYEEQVDAWHAQRLARLQAEDGWLTLVGLHALEPGANTIGAGADRDVQLAADTPEAVGVLHIEVDGAWFAPADGAAVQVDGEPVTGSVEAATDADGSPTVFRVGTVRFHVITRGDRYFLRVKDSASEVRRAFEGIDRFPVDPAWRIEARLISEGQPATVPSVNVLGQVSHEPSPGVLEFELDGRTHRLVATGEPGTPLFIVFADATSGHRTYGGGRFLSTGAPDANGRVTLDFNRAVNPPCAFTPHATCPMPPPENRLPVAVAAGEKAWGTHH